MKDSDNKDLVRVRLLTDGRYVGWEKHRTFPVIVWARECWPGYNVPSEQLKAIGLHYCDELYFSSIYGEVELVK